MMLVRAIGGIDLDRRVSDPEPVLQSYVDGWDDRQWIGSRLAADMKRDHRLFGRQRPCVNMMHFRYFRHRCGQVGTQCMQVEAWWRTLEQDMRR